MTNFFGVGIPEVLLIMVLTLIVVGPSRLPEMAREIGRLVREMRRYARMFRDEFTTEFGNLQSELEVSQTELSEARRQLQDASQSVTGEVGSVRDDLARASNDVTSVLQRPVETGATPVTPPAPNAGEEPTNIIQFGDAAQRAESDQQPATQDAPPPSQLQRH